MKINMIKSILTIGAFMIAVLSVNAQKFGYLNSAQLLSELPEVKSADSDLEAYQKQLMSAGEAMVKSLETKYTAYAKEAQEGLFSQVEMQQKQAEIEQEQQKIQQYEVEVQNKIIAKRETLYKPILDKVKTALEELGKE